MMLDSNHLGTSTSSVLKLAAVAIILGVGRIVLRIIYRLYFHPLRSFPGPKSWACSYLPSTSKSLAGDAPRAYLQLHQKYGSIVRITPDNLSYSNAIVWKDVWGYRKGHDEFAKVSSSTVKTAKGQSGILSADTTNHRRFRKQLSPAFSEKAMREQQPIILKHVDLLVKGLGSCSGKEPQDLVKWFNWTSFDIIGRLAFGESFGCLEKKEDHPWIEAIFGSIKAGAFMSSLDRLGLNWVKRFITPSKSLQIRMMNQRFSEEKIKNRLALGEGNGDFWDQVLKIKDDQSRMSVAEMTSNASNIVLGGSETTATLLSGCIYLLLLHPSIMEKVTAELHQHFTSSDDIDLFTVSHLAYTLAVLRETMRIYPPVPVMAPRQVPRGGGTVDGRYLPEGTKIGCCQYAVNHLESNFRHPEQFIPERFMGYGAFRNDQFDAFQPFSVGPRNCIGKNLADAEMRLILAKVLWSFEFELHEKTGNWMDQKSYILWQKKPLLVHVKARSLSI
ncbi:cytochrome P450 [Xylaria longipes]|nr:cytochrome P450 [Xylaria longipes]